MKSSLNHVFRVIWSEVQNAWVAVSELTRRQGKLSSSSAARHRQAGKSGKFCFGLVSLALACCFSPSLYANPNGAQVVNGSATFSQTGNVLNITNTPGAIINWQSFSIGGGETTRFIQQSASSAVLNRVVGPDPSVLLGTLTSNGQVYLINSAGIMVGQGALIDVPRFVASSLNLSNADFLAGKMNFTAVQGAGGISNQGTITTPEGGSVYLVAPQVENAGIINTPKGETILAAGETVTLVDTGTPGVTVQVTGSANSATNLGQIIADTGRIGMVGALVKNSGTLNANSLVSQGGRIYLKATQTATVDAGSQITATGAMGGTVEVLGNQVNVAGAIDASGTNSGGTILVGGDAHGTNAAVQNAQNTVVAATATLNADAIQNGNGGKVVVWSDIATQFNGSISAKGGAQGGNGGWVETSGRQTLSFNGLVNTTAANGMTGSLLLDPTNITISAAPAVQSATLVQTPVAGMTTITDLAAPSTILDTTILALLTGTNVTIDTTSVATGGLGNITVATPLAWNSANSLTLNAVGTGSITVNAGAGISNGGTGGISLLAAGGNITVGANIFTGGTLAMTAGGNISITDANVQSTGNMTVNVGGNLNIAATGTNPATGAWLQAGVMGATPVVSTQTITFNGAVAHQLSITGGAGVNAGASANLSSTGLQTINFTAGTLGITLTGGTTNSNTQNLFQWANGIQGTQVCAACVTNNFASIESQGGQTINATTITALGGSGGNGNWANIWNGSTTVAQNITTTGAITLTGGASGGYYNAAFPNDGATNEGAIHSNATQVVNAASISMTGGGGGVATLGGAFLTSKLAQTIATTGALTMTGGNSTGAGQYGFGSPVIIGEQVGASITLNVGSLFMTGGGTAGNAALIGAASGAPTIGITAGSISMATGSQIGVLTGGPAGSLSLTANGTGVAISEDATSAINTATLAATAAGGSISLAGANKVNTVTNLTGTAVTYNSAQLVHLGNVAGGAGAVALTTAGAGSHLYLGTVSGSTVSATSSGGIYDDNASGTTNITATNITATTSASLSATGGMLGNMAVSSDVNSPSITVSVSGTYGGIRIGSMGATAPTTVSLTDAATNPQNIFFSDWSSPALTLGAGMLFNAGTGALSIGTLGSLVYSGSTLTAGSVELAASGTVTQTAAITTPVLYVKAIGGATLNSANMVTDIAATSGAGFAFTNAQSMRITTGLGGSGTSYSGINATTGNVVLATTGAASDMTASSLGVNFSAIIANNGNVTLNAGRDVLIGNGVDGRYADIYAYGAGTNINITAARNILIDNFSYVYASQGNVNLAATTGNVSVRSSVNPWGSWVGAAGAVSLSAGGSILAPAAGTGGDIGGGYITTGTGNLSATAVNGITLTGANGVAGFTASNTAAGDINLVNTYAGLTLGALSNAGGNVFITNTGAVIVNGVESASGAYSIIAHSPITVNAGASITAGGALTLTAGAANSLLAGDVIILNGALSGASINLGGYSVTGTIPAGAILQVPSAATIASTTAAVQQAVTTATTATVNSTTSTTTGSSTANTSTAGSTSGTPTVAPVVVATTTTTTSTGLMNTTGPGSIGGATGTFGGNDPSLGSASTSSTSSGTSTTAATDSGASASGGGTSSAGATDSSDGSADSGNGKDAAKSKEDSDKNNGKDDHEKSNAKPEKC